MAGHVPVVTYKPGYAVTVTVGRALDFLDERAEVTLLVRYEGPDAAGSGKTVPLSFRKVEFVRDAEHFRHFVAASIRELELHEAHEWLRFDGVRFRDPHDRPATTRTWS